MRIGVMLRSLDEKGGIGMYTRYLIEGILNADSKNEYVLFYKSRENLGRFADKPNVKEIYLSGSNKVFWDQIKVALACKKEKVDLVFNPKFTVPLSFNAFTTETVTEIPSSEFFRVAWAKIIDEINNASAKITCCILFWFKD